MRHNAEWAQSLRLDSEDYKPYQGVRTITQVAARHLPDTHLGPGARTGCLWSNLWCGCGTVGGGCRVWQSPPKIPRSSRLGPWAEPPGTRGTGTPRTPPRETLNPRARPATALFRAAYGVSLLGERRDSILFSILSQPQATPTIGAAASAELSPLCMSQKLTETAASAHRRRASRLSVEAPLGLASPISYFCRPFCESAAPPAPHLCLCTHAAGARWRYGGH